MNPPAPARGKMKRVDESLNVGTREVCCERDNYLRDESGVK